MKARPLRPFVVVALEILALVALALWPLLAYP